MRAIEFKGNNIVIWGTGVEGRAAADFIRRFLPAEAIIFVDERSHTDTGAFTAHDTLVSGEKNIEPVLEKADVIVKSPGVSLYHPLIERAKKRGVPVTSLLSLWFAEKRSAKTILVTGSKGKSTVSSLLGAALTALGKKTYVAGNIGVPLSEVPEDGDYVVIETSSYQAADFDGMADLSVVISLFPEHLDWHGTLPRYYRDKLNLLQHSRVKILSGQALATMEMGGEEIEKAIMVNTPDSFHVENKHIYEGTKEFGTLTNRHLSRQHNLENVCVVLTIVRELGLDTHAALAALESFEGLPHREFELGMKDGILFVDDSISTTPQSTIAALEAYKDRAITLIAGGFDRGIDYAPLADYLIQNKTNAVICLGPSGVRIHELLKDTVVAIFDAHDMQEAILLVRQHTREGGVVLLSPAAPSFGLFKDYIERGNVFAAAAGFLVD